MRAMEDQTAFPPALLQQHFWNVFIVDALIGNWDRHNGNWGFLYNTATDEIAIAPVYDCGSCLYPQADEAIMRDTIDKQPERDFRTFSIPLSALRSMAKKINYFDFISSLENADCSKALKRYTAQKSTKWMPNFSGIRRIRDSIHFGSAKIACSIKDKCCRTRKRRILDFAMEKLRKREKSKELEAR